jgi:phosphatidylinositol-3-phosphatase
MRKSVLAVAAMLALALAAPAGAGARGTTGPPPVRHVFTIILENENADVSFGPDSPAPYLSKTLPSKGAFIPQYYAITHESLGNYIGLVSGQGSNVETQADCQIYSDFVGVVGPDGQAIGQGCVYPAAAKTVADQLTARGFTWKGYMEDMGNDTTREAALCGRPQLNTRDNTQNATADDQYAARHNPFVYFHSIVDDPVSCEQHDVPLTELSGDLSRARNTPNYAFITPDLCNDGHDGDGTPGSCADGGPGGLVAADAFLKTWVPKILGSPAFKKDGLLLVTFDEAEGTPPEGDASACCNEPQFPNTPNNGGPVPGMGGGRVGAVALSPFIRGGTVTSTAYNHFSTLRTVESLFGLPFLGYAGSPDPGSFGRDVFSGSF